MKIDSGLSGYQYPNRTLDLARKTEDAPQRETAPVKRSPGAITGSSTLLSSSLANALWVMESQEGSTAGSDLGFPIAASDRVAGAYEEFG